MVFKYLAKSAGFVAIAFTLGIHSTSADAQEITSDFTVDNEGWAGTGGAVSFNGAGYLIHTDNASTWMRLIAPSKFWGDLSPFENGQIRFDAINANGANPNLSSLPWFGTIEISGPNGSASIEAAGSGPGEPLSDGQWQTYTVSLDAGLWTGDLTGALSNVTSITVVTEFANTIVEVAGFDNFTISSANEIQVPIPAFLLFTLAGLLASVVYFKRD